MTHVATLVCNPGFPALFETLVQKAAAVLPGAAPVKWLNQNIAADIFFDGSDGELRAFTDQIRNALGTAEIDVIVQRLDNRRKKLFLADMDSTMIGQDCIDELADAVSKKKQVAEITERAMRGEIEFESALRERVALLKGLHPDTVLRVIEQKITLSPGARVLVQTLRANGVHCILVSGGFTNFTSVIAEKIGFHENHANRLALGEDGRFSGLVEEPILGKQAKLDALLHYREKLNLKPEDTMAVGDGANDLAMIEASGLGFAYRAKPAVAAAAQARIEYSDLTALLYAQGYSHAEFWSEPRPTLNPSDWKRKYGNMEKAHERRS
jgi:phosphoserine phosphatase